jgi:Fic family protein
MPRYIYQQADWPNFYWDKDKLSAPLARLHLRQGRLMGTLNALGFSLQHKALLESLTLEVIKSSEIEGEILDPHQVCSSIARRLQLPLEYFKKANKQTEGAVEVVLDATQHFDQDLSKERLCRWQYLLLQSDYTSAYLNLRLGDWRNDAHGPMQIVSGPIGRERVHFQAPPAEVLPHEMEKFIQWVNLKDDMDPILKAGIAHYWFVTLHPFDDGNGRIARAITDWMMARHEQTALRFYSMSAQIRRERNAYYSILESTSKGTLNITAYLEWFIDMLEHTFETTEKSIQTALNKANFWESHKETALNERQKLMLNKLMEDFEGKLTAQKWGKMTKVSEDTALRDINALIKLDILQKDPAGGRSTSYSLKNRAGSASGSV